MTEAERLAQQWHDDQVRDDPAHEQYSTCWCCCMSCDPDWVECAGNPYWVAAKAGAS